MIILSLIVLKTSLIWKSRAAFIKALLIASLGVSIILESLGSLFVHKHLPEASIMSLVSVVAFVGNLLTLWFLKKHRKEDINMHSAWACSQADLLTNIGMIVTSFCVFFFDSGFPDSLLGVIIGAFITKSAIIIIDQTRYQLR